MTEHEVSAILARLDALHEDVADIKSATQADRARFITREEMDVRCRRVDAEFAAMRLRIDHLEQRGEWIVRTVGGLLIAAALAAVIAAHH